MEDGFYILRSARSEDSAYLLDKATGVDHLIQRHFREGSSIFPDQRGGKQWSKYILVTLLQKTIIIFSDVTVEEDRSP
jgi:hypothetical protein